MMRKTILLSLLAVSILIWWFQPPAQLSSTNAQGMAPIGSSAPLTLMPVRAKSIVPSDSAKLPSDQYLVNKKSLRSIVQQKDIPLNEIEDFGYGAIPILAELYKDADNNLDKSKIAWVFWKLGWKSQEIEDALLPDLDSNDSSLKVWVQWGIAKSTQSNKVIDKLLNNLENDSSAFVRNKAACALASDFIHVSTEQRVTILKGLVKGLANDNIQIRALSLQALVVHTGQTKNFSVSANQQSRKQAIEAWNDWITEYEQSI